MPFASRGSGVQIPSAPPETAVQSHDHHRRDHGSRLFDRHSTVAQAVSDLCGSGRSLTHRFRFLATGCGRGSGRWASCGSRSLTTALTRSPHGHCPRESRERQNRSGCGTTGGGVRAGGPGAGCIRGTSPSTVRLPCMSSSTLEHLWSITLMVPIHLWTMVLCVGSSERGIRGPGGLWPLARGLWPLASPETPGPGLGVHDEKGGAR